MLLHNINCYQINITYWYHPNHLGSIEWVTNADGRPVEYFWYSPWGETLHEDNSWRGRFRSPFKFTGHVEDEETGLTYAGARYYPARVGKWLSVDPMHSERSWLTPYNYVQNNPISRIDPDGMLDGEFEWDNANKEWQKTSTKGDEIGVDFYHWDGAGGSQTTYVTDREGNWNTITNGREALQGTSRDESVDWKQIYSEWKSGTGPEYSLMEGDHPANQEINKDIWLDIDHRSFLNSGDSKGRYDRNFGILGALDAGPNMQLQMMGSYSTSFYKLGDKTLTLIFDSKSRTSFYYHAGIPNYSRQTGWPSSTGMGKRETTTRQTYMFFK